MLHIKKLSHEDFKCCFNLINDTYKEKVYFEKLGWGLNQFKNQLIKENDFSLALFDDHLMTSFILGDIISIEKIVEYEILLLYVNNKFRKLGYASKLLNKIQDALGSSILNKIYLEVSSVNVSAIKLYKKNKFNKIGVRKKYYSYNNKKIDALVFEKIINE